MPCQKYMCLTKLPFTPLKTLFSKFSTKLTCSKKIGKSSKSSHPHSGKIKLLSIQYLSLNTMLETLAGLSLGAVWGTLLEFVEGTVLPPVCKLFALVTQVPCERCTPPGSCTKRLHRLLATIKLRICTVRSSFNWCLSRPIIWGLTRF